MPFMQPIYAYDIFSLRTLSGTILVHNSHAFTDHMHAITELTALIPACTTVSFFVYLIVTCKFTAIW